MKIRVLINLIFPLLFPLCAAAGWLSGNLRFAAMFENNKAMAPATVCLVIFLVASVWFSCNEKTKLAKALTFVSSSLLITIFFSYIGIFPANIEYYLILKPLKDSIHGLNTGQISNLSLISISEMNFVLIIKLFFHQKNIPMRLFSYPQLLFFL